jgi:hypothetical protein
MIYKNRGHQPFHFPSNNFDMKGEFRRQLIDLYHEHHKIYLTEQMLFNNGLIRYLLVWIPNPLHFQKANF